MSSHASPALNPAAEAPDSEEKQATTTVESARAAIKWIAKCVALVFFFWQALALFWGPMPDFYSKSTLDAVLRPYLRATNNDHRWAFFAPNPGRARIVTAQLQLADGQVRETQLWKWLPRSHPAYLRMTSMLDEVRSDSPAAVRAIAQQVCHHHREAHSVRLVVDRQYVLSADEYEQGKRPLDAEFLEREEMEAVPCPR